MMLESTPFNSDFDQEEPSLKDVDRTSTYLGGFKAASTSQKRNIYLLISVLSNVMMALALAFLLLARPQADERKNHGPQKISSPPGKSGRPIVLKSQLSVY